jgi:hypothetical protein
MSTYKGVGKISKIFLGKGGKGVGETVGGTGSVAKEARVGKGATAKVGRAVKVGSAVKAGKED